MNRLSVLVAIASCSSKSSGPPEPETYSYSLAMGPRFNANPNIQISINGKPAGTNNRVVVPKGVKLGDPATKLEAVFETTCGPTPFALAAFSLNPDETAERGKDPTATISWSVSAPDSMPDATDVYLDNKWGKPTTIEIGNRSFSVGNMTSKNVKVAFGTCATARTVKIDGKLVGEVPALEQRWAALISTTKDMCYAQGSEIYGADIYAGNEEHSKVHVFKQPDFVGKVPVTDYALVEPPEEVVSEVARHTVLISLPCELWAKQSKPPAKKRR